MQEGMVYSFRAALSVSMHTTQGSKMVMAVMDKFRRDSISLLHLIELTLIGRMQHHLVYVNNVTV